MRNMESLTERLSFLMKQISDDHINQLIMKNRLNNELMMEQEQKVNTLQYNKFMKTKTTCDKNKSISKMGRNLILKHHRQKTKEPAKPKTLISLANIWSGQKSNKVNGDKDVEISKETPKEEKTAKDKFLKAAKLAVLISQVKKGHSICTCDSLDSKCKLHDN